MEAVVDISGVTEAT